MNSGYLHKNYAHSIKENPQVIYLNNSNSWLIQHDIPESTYVDASSCYPLHCCQNWDYLINDIKKITNDIVSLKLVSEPFASIDVDSFMQYFDTFNEYKQHFIVDFKMNSNVSLHHKKEVKRALKKSIEVKLCNSPLNYLSDWVDLFLKLIQRHNIKNDTVFSKLLFFNQFNIPGFFAFRAEINNQLIGMVLWYLINDKVYYHLAAYSKLGYETGASYALMDYSLRYFKEIGASQATLGAGAGLDSNNKDGLSYFKFGWSNYTKPVYFFGKVVNQIKYNSLIKDKKSKYFPAYRLF